MLWGRYRTGKSGTKVLGDGGMTLLLVSKILLLIYHLIVIVSVIERMEEEILFHLKMFLFCPHYEMIVGKVQKVNSKLFFLSILKMFFLVFYPSIISDEKYGAKLILILL